MPSRLRQQRLQRYAAEVGENQPADGSFRVALLFPNHYAQAMANLGYQTVYQLFNRQPGYRCERLFLPDPSELALHERLSQPLQSLETGTPLREFDLIALSISFENDYLHLPQLFSLGQVPLLRTQRSAQDPLVLLGGVCAFLNPEPLAELVDLVAVGEAEAIFPQLLPALPKCQRSGSLHPLGELPGVYLPHEQPLQANDHGGLVPGAEAPVRRQYLANLEDSASRSFISSPESAFGEMSLVEVMRGCRHGCRFCAAGYIYLPLRERSPQQLLPQFELGLQQRQRLGLVGAAVADHSDFSQLQQMIAARGGELSVSSLRLDALTREEAEALQAMGMKTVAIAPEAGSQRMRDAINKNLNQEQILDAVKLLAAAGLMNLKLYLLIGLPGETEEDLREMLQLGQKISDLWRQAGRDRGCMGTLTLSVNPFVPKPFTPFQWCGMESEKQLKKKVRFLQSGVSRLPNTRLIHESIRSARLQALFSRGDRRLGPLLGEIAAGGNPGQILRRHQLSLRDEIERQREQDEAFPWEVIDPGVGRNYLWREYQRALSLRTSPACHDGCRGCGLC